MLPSGGSSAQKEEVDHQGVGYEAGLKGAVFHAALRELALEVWDTRS